MPIKSQAFRSLTVVLLAMSVVACGEDTSAPGDGAEPGTDELQAEALARSTPVDLDPCALVSQAEIERILGFTVDTPERSVTPAGSSLTYFSCSSDDVHVDVQVWDSADNAASSFATGTSYPSIDGIGDRAQNTQPLGDLDVLHGRYVVTVDIFSSLTQDEELEAAKKIAEIVLSRLP